MKSFETPVIETERLLLLQLGPDSFNALFEQLNNEELLDFFGYETQEPLDVELERHRDGLSGFRRSFVWFIIKQKETGKSIGSCGFHTWMTFHNRAEIGYSLVKEEYMGKGYMKEVLTAVIQYGFEKMDLHRIEALVGPDNEPSLRLMKHFGFTKEGHLREHYMKNGVMEDSVVFSLLKSEYKK